MNRPGVTGPPQGRDVSGSDSDGDKVRLTAVGPPDDLPRLLLLTQGDREKKRREA